MRSGWSIVLLIVLLVIALGYPNDSGLWYGFLQKGDEQIIEQKLFWILRLPELSICIIAGSCLAVCGLLLQTFLNNPLAGPDILGITSGSHLLVALSSMATGSLASIFAQLSNTLAAAMGALAFGLLILVIAGRLRSNTSLLLVGLMAGTFVAAITSIIITKADPSAIKAFTLWSYGSLSKIELTDFFVILPILFFGKF